MQYLAPPTPSEASAPPATADPPVTVIVCVYTARRLWALKAALAAVRDQMRGGDELVVVIDHNRGLFQLARRLLAADPGGTAARVRLLPNENARGLSGARNTGIAAAEGELVVFLDDDAVPRAGWLASLIEPFSEPDVIGVGGAVAPAWEHDPPDWFPEEFLWVVGCSYKGLPERAAEIRNPIGATMAFRRRVLDEVGRFTDGVGRIGQIPLGCEETELSIRARRATGGRIIQQPAAAVDHVVPAERLRFTYFMRRCWGEGISKAVVSRLAGAEAALACERRYTTRTLSAGIRAGLREGLTGDSSGFKRATTIVAGLGIAAGGYVRGSASRTRRGPAEHPPAPQTGGFTPIWTGELEMTAPSLPSRIVDANGKPYELGRILVRAGGTVLGFMELETTAGHLDLALAIERAQATFGDHVARAVADTGWTAERNERVSIVLCTHNRTTRARRALESLQSLRHTNVEIIVVDSAPADDKTRRLVSELAEADPRVRYVCDEVKGLSRARNRGLREATGEYVVYTDDDVRVDGLWINGLLRGFDREPGVACVTGLVASGSLKHPAEQYFDRRFGWSAKCEPRVFTRQRTPRDSRLHPYAAGAFGTGANFAVKVSVLRAIGGFDECLGAGSPTCGGEDLDIFVRIITSGHTISYEPSALVWHDHRVEDASLTTQMYAYGLGLTAFLTKHMLEPESRGAFARRIPAGLAHALTLVRRSRAAAQASFDKAQLTRTETLGMLAGPFVYLQARRRQARSEFNVRRPNRSDRA